VLAAGSAFFAAAIGLATLWVALNTRSWDEFEGVLIVPLIAVVALAAGWACALGVGLLRHRTWARSWAIFTFLIVSGFSGWASLDLASRVVDGTAPTQHIAAPASLLSLATSNLLFVISSKPERS
jgi:hypothetical protein